MSVRLSFAIVVVASVVAAWPVLWSTFPIAQDLPAHIETAAQLAGLWRGDSDVAQRLVAHAPPWPNSAPTALLAGVVALTSGAADPLAAGLAAGSALFFLGVALWPIALAVLAHRLGRTPLVALAALPTAFDLSFSYGFFHFVLGKPVCALTLVVAVAVARGAPRALLATALVVLFHVHLLLFVVCVPICVVTLCALSERRTWALHAVAVAIGAAPGGWWVATHPAPPGTNTYATLTEALRGAWGNLGDLGPGHLDVVPWVLAACALAALSIRAGERRGATREAIVVALTGVTLLGLAFLGPTRTPSASVVAERFMSLGVALLVLAAPAVAPARTRVTIALICGVAAAVVVSVDLHARFSAFERDDQGDLLALLREVPRGAVVATHYASSAQSAHGRHNARWHWPKLLALRGAITDDTFALRDTCVVVTKPGAWPAHPPLARGYSAAMLSPFSHVLVSGDDTRARQAAARGFVELVARQATWSLWRVRATPST